MNAGGGVRLRVTGYAVSAVLFVASVVIVASLVLLEQIFRGTDAPVPRDTARA